MTRTWKKIKLGDIATEIRDTYLPNPNDHLNYIGLEHIEQQSLRLNDVGISSSMQSAKKIFKANDILFGSLRPYFRKIVKPKFSGVCSTDITIIRSKGDCSQDFLFYFIANQKFVDYATSVSYGTRMPRATWKVLSKSEWLFPPYNIQCKIAFILSSYDDFVETNNCRVKILEEIIRLNYKEWFVKFKFPGYEKIKKLKSELGMIPEGWKVKKIEEVVERIHPGKLYDSNTVNKSGNIPVLDQGRSGIIGYHDDEPGVKANENNPIIVFANHTCYQNLILFPFSAIQNVLPFISSKTNFRNIFWLYWATKGLVKFNDYKGHWPEFVNKKLIVPPPHICDEFGKLVRPMVLQKYKLQQQNNILHQTRDILLPKLISGEITVSELDIGTKKNI